MARREDGDMIPRSVPHGSARSIEARLKAGKGIGDGVPRQRTEGLMWRQTAWVGAIADSKENCH